MQKNIYKSRKHQNLKYAEIKQHTPKQLMDQEKIAGETAKYFKMNEPKTQHKILSDVLFTEKEL